MYGNKFRNVFKLKASLFFSPGRLKTSSLYRLESINFKRYTTSSVTQKYSVIDARYNSVYVNIFDEYQTPEEFQQSLQGLLKKWAVLAKKSAFLDIPISQSHLIAIASSYGFQYHHAKDKKAVLSMWLAEGKENKIPHYSNHTIGVAGACFNQDTHELLLVKDKGKYNKWWKFPGGFSDIGEFIGDTAVREVFEETGVKSDFQSLLSFRQQHDTVFGQSDLYFICRLHPLTYDITLCPDEIENAQWVSVDEIFKMNDTTPFVKIITRLIMEGKDENFRNIDIVGEEVESWVVKNKKMILYHRDIDWR